jgi:hypothetical protein
VVDHDGYNHFPNAEDIADSFSSFPYATPDDFEPVDAIDMVIDDGLTQKSIGSFQNTGVQTGDPFDILIKQTAWTEVNCDWGLLQWTVTNTKTPAAALTNFAIGLEIPFSKDGARFGVGGDMADGGDDVDGFDSSENVYWVQDTDSGITVGVGSAIATDPITHYYGKDYHSDYSSEYRNFFANDTWLYNRLKAPNALATDGVTPGNITTTLGWDGITINPGESRTFTMVVAVNNTKSNMITAVKDAQDYYFYKATGFVLTEISDSGSGTPQIEIYNFGRQTTDVSSILTLSANVGTLSGTWSPSVVPTYGYSIFTPSQNIDSEGDTIRLYESGMLVDSVSFGLDGEASDPLDSESTSRYFNPFSESYSNLWTRNSSTGPTWGSHGPTEPQCRDQRGDVQSKCVRWRIYCTIQQESID